MKIQEFFDADTSTLTYLAYDPESLDAVIIDPVWNFDAASGKLTTKSVDLLVKFVREHELVPRWILETHAHADHISGSWPLKQIFPQARLGIGARIREVQSTFAKVFNLTDLKTDGSQFDHIFQDGEILHEGALQFRVFFTPGHTPACVCFQFGSVVFTGDSIFMPDSGTGRCDFPGGSASSLYESIVHRIFELPDDTVLMVGHDYQPGGRPLKFSTTVLEQKVQNIHLKGSTSKEEFVAFREGRDKALSAPKLLLPSMQININAGHLPAPESNGARFLKIPLG